VRPSSPGHLHRAGLAQRRGKSAASLARELAAEAVRKAADAELAASVQLTDSIRRLYAGGATGFAGPPNGRRNAPPRWRNT
jgi:hypothetical protein